MVAQLIDEELLAGNLAEIEPEQRPRQTKKQRILELHAAGTTNLLDLARAVDTSLNYVASVLTGAGLLTGYYDLFTSTAHPMNQHGRLFQGVLSFKTVEAAQASVERIDQLYRYFEYLGDRSGQHHAMVMAMTGRNRALACHKQAEADVFSTWLMQKLAESPAPVEETATESDEFNLSAKK